MDYSLFNFNYIFGVLNSTKDMKRGQLFFRSEIVDKSIAKNSGDQLVYVGDKEDGFDFMNGSRKIENKTKKNLFSKSKTRSVILKNFNRNSPPSYPNQTFDELLLWDEHTNSVYSCQWETVKKYWYLTGSNISFKDVPKSELNIIVENVIPDKITLFSPLLDQLVENYITQNTTTLSRREIESAQKTLQLFT